METASSVIKSALQEILVQASEAPIEPSEAQDTLTYMNRYMASLAARGVNLGYTKVTALNDPITIPDGAIEGLVFKVAERIAPQFDKQDVTSGMSFRQNAREALHAMYSIAVQPQPAQYPGILPIGSGNEDDVQAGDHFYPDQTDKILTEQTGSIFLEESTLADE